MPAGGQNKINLLGQRFGKLVVIAEAEPSIRGLANWVCQCDCGNKYVTSGYYLRQDRKKSCGCQNCRLCGKDNPNWSGYQEISGSFWHTVRQGAKTRNLELSITIKDAWELFIQQNRKCALTGLELVFCPSDKRRRSDLSTQTASLDRIDSSTGYIFGNIQWVHKDINRMKIDFDNDYFVYMCTLVGKNHNE